MPLVAILLLAAGTYAFRLVGAAAHATGRLTPRTRDVVAAAAAVLLVALVTTGAVADGSAPAGWARPVGVGLAVVLAARGASFVVVVLTAVGVTAGLRLLGVA